MIMVLNSYELILGLAQKIVKNPNVASPEGTSTAGPSSIATSLLVRLRERDSAAWERLAELFGPVVYLWCRQAGLRAEDAADVGQEVFQAVASHLDDFRRERPGDTFRGWVWTIAQNKIRDHWRRQQGRPEAAGGTDAQQRLAQWPEEETTSSDGLPRGESAIVARRALQLVRSEFQERTWQAFWRVAVDGRAPEEVARELGMSRNSVFIAKSRILQRLRKELGDPTE